MTEHECKWSDDLGKYLRKLRQSAGLSLRETASRSELHFTYLSRIETNKFAPPSCEALKRLATVYKCNPDVLLASANRLDPDISKWLINNPAEIRLLRDKMREES
jgi:transcriptional regulator with XRE-family HTH domain